MLHVRRHKPRIVTQCNLGDQQIRCVDTGIRWQVTSAEYAGAVSDVLRHRFPVDETQERERVVFLTRAHASEYLGPNDGGADEVLPLCDEVFEQSDGGRMIPQDVHEE